jgi:tetratricopeptide (TPR) repeat protein
MNRLAVMMIVVLTPLRLSAGVYDPDRPAPFRLVNNQIAALDFEPGNTGEFAIRYSAMMNWLDNNPKRKNDDRAAVIARIQTFKPEDKTPQQLAAHAYDLIHTGQPERAISILQPISRGRSASFVVLMNLAHAYAVTGDWNAAIRTHDIAMDADIAADLKTESPEIRAWLSTIEKKYYRAWLRWNLNNPKPNPESQEVIPLFTTEKPAEAIPIVQQLLLWQPGDTNLYWLLGELYRADGQLRQAEVIFNQCANSRQYSNRKIMMAHRADVIDAVSKLPPDAPPTLETSPGPPPGDWDDGLPPLRNVLFAIGIFGPLAVLLIVFQVLRFRKSRRK